MGKRVPLTNDDFAAECARLAEVYECAARALRCCARMKQEGLAEALMARWPRSLSATNALVSADAVLAYLRGDK